MPPIDLYGQLDDLELRLMLVALESTYFNVTKAAQELQINRTTLVEKMRKHGLRGPLKSKRVDPREELDFDAPVKNSSDKDLAK